MQLRDFQLRIKGKVFEQWEKHRSTCVVCCTGGGKTIIFSHIINDRIDQLGGRALVIAHRKELIYQARDKIEKSVGLECDIEMGFERADQTIFSRKPVVIATVQTLTKSKCKRMQRWKPEEFHTIVCDEFHHGTSATYRAIFNYFGENPNLKIVGVTATPDRADEEALGQVCDSVADIYDILDGVNDGWLVPVTQQFVKIKGLDFSHARTTAGDLNEGDLAKIMEEEECVQRILQASVEAIYGLAPKTLTPIAPEQWKDFLSDKKARRTIIFTVSVAQASMYSKILNSRVYPELSEWICAQTCHDKRADILSQFANGMTSVVVNCGILTEGYDNPAVEMIIMARPTKSRSLYTQMVGRSTRPLPSLVDGLETSDARKSAIDESSKPRCRIIDFVGNSGRHKLICALDILSGKCSQEAIDRAIEDAKEEGKPVTVTKQISNAEALIEWEKKKEAKRLEEIREAHRRSIVAKADYSTRDVDPFGKPQGTFWQTNRKAKSSWRFTTKQRSFLRKWLGLDPDSVEYGYGTKLIAKKISEWKAKDSVSSARLGTGQTKDLVATSP